MPKASGDTSPRTFGKHMKAAVCIAIFLIGLLVGFCGRSHFDFYFMTHRGIQWDFNDAAMLGDIPKMEVLVKNGAKIDAIPEDDGGNTGWTALSEAVDRLQPESTRWLLEHGADPDSNISDGNPRGGAIYNLKKAQEIVDIMNQHPPKSKKQ